MSKQCLVCAWRWGWRAGGGRFTRMEWLQDAELRSHSKPSSTPQMDQNHAANTLLSTDASLVAVAVCWRLRSIRGACEGVLIANHLTGLRGLSNKSRLCVSACFLT
jgi:hypothetical protein